MLDEFYLYASGIVAVGPAAESQQQQIDPLGILSGGFQASQEIHL